MQPVHAESRHSQSWDQDFCDFPAIEKYFEKSVSFQSHPGTYILLRNSSGRKKDHFQFFADSQRKRVLFLLRRGGRSPDAGLPCRSSIRAAIE